MGARGLGAVLLLALLGAAGGYAAGQASQPATTLADRATPVPASDPSLPVDPEVPYSDDIPYPALLPSLEYRQRTIGDRPYEWVYLTPRGWTREVIGPDEVRWRPADEPLVGGYSLRVKITSEHKTRAAMVAQKLAALEAGYQDVEVLGRTADLLSFSYRDTTRNTQRFNTFQWFSVPGSQEAMFEMSVVGRAVDRPGLADLLEQVSRRVSIVQ